MMKKIILAGLLAATFGLAQADDSTVTVYGRMDLGIGTSTNVGSANGNSTGIISNADYASRIGFKGQDNLGGGVRAGFDLEAGFTPADGNQNNGGNNGQNSNLFNRKSDIYIGSDSLGTLKMGRQQNPMIEGMEVGEVRGGSNFGTNITFWDDASSFGGSSTSKTGVSNLTGGYWMSNVIRYDTPTFAGLRGMLAYTPGGVAGDGTLGAVQDSNKEFATLFYTYKDFNAAIGHDEFHSSTGASNAQTNFVSANYTYGKLKVAGGWSNIKNPSVGAGVANSDFDMSMISAMYKVTPVDEVSVGYYDFKDNANGNNGAKQYSLMAKHYLSKRVDVWAGVTQVANKGSSGFGSTSAGTGNASLNSLSNNYQAYPTIAGQTQTSYMVGMAYAF